MQSWRTARLLDRAAAAVAAPCARLGGGARVCRPGRSPAGLPDPAWARSGSGGYSRPSGGNSSFSSRRPSIGGSGGYRRPSASAPVFGGSSPGDRAISRGQSSDALRNYRASQRPPPGLRAATLGTPARGVRRWLGSGDAAAGAVLGRRLGLSQPAALVRHRRRDRGRAVGGAQRAVLVAEPSRVFLRAPQRPGLSRVAAGGRTHRRERPRSGRKARRTRPTDGAADRRSRAAPAAAPPSARARKRRVLALGHRSRHWRCCRAVLAVAAPRRPSAPSRPAAGAAPGLAGSAESRFRVGWCCRSIRRRFCSPPA